MSMSDLDAIANLEFGPSMKSCLSSGDLMSMEKPESQPKRRVSFGKLEIRKYEQVVGDSVVSAGVPISLGWDYSNTVALDVGVYEELKISQRSQREMRLPSDVRMALVKNTGLSLRDGMQAAMASDIERIRRRASAAKSPEMDRAELVLEQAKRKARRLLRRRNKEKEKENKEITDLIQRDRMRSSNRRHLHRRNSCPTLDLLTCDPRESEVIESPRELAKQNHPESTCIAGTGAICFEDDSQPLEF